MLLVGFDLFELREVKSCPTKSIGKPLAQH
jgi:hypothetical protein